MKWFMTALLSEQGEISTMRLMSLTSMFCGIILAIYGIWSGKDLGGVAQLVGIFVGASFAGKASQKFMETK